VEETLNHMLDTEADLLCGAKRYKIEPTDGQTVINVSFTVRTEQFNLKMPKLWGLRCLTNDGHLILHFLLYSSFNSHISATPWGGGDMIMSDSIFITSMVPNEKAKLKDAIDAVFMGAVVRRPILKDKSISVEKIIQKIYGKYYKGLLE
jgi:hypothetical protein